MEKSDAVKYCTSLMYSLGRVEKKELLEKSNLTDREISAISMRYIEGCSTQECADRVGLSLNGFCKMQRRSLHKLYHWLVVPKN